MCEYLVISLSGENMPAGKIRPEATIHTIFKEAKILRPDPNIEEILINA